MTRTILTVVLTAAFLLPSAAAFAGETPTELEEMSPVERSLAYEELTAFERQTCKTQCGEPLVTLEVPEGRMSINFAPLPKGKEIARVVVRVYSTGGRVFQTWINLDPNVQVQLEEDASYSWAPSLGADADWRKFLDSHLLDVVDKKQLVEMACQTDGVVRFPWEEVRSVLRLSTISGGTTGSAWKRLPPPRVPFQPPRITGERSAPTPSFECECTTYHYLFMAHNSLKEGRWSDQFKLRLKRVPPPAKK